MNKHVLSILLFSLAMLFTGCDQLGGQSPSLESTSGEKGTDVREHQAKPDDFRKNGDTTKAAADYAKARKLGNDVGTTASSLIKGNIRSSPEQSAAGPLDEGRKDRMHSGLDNVQAGVLPPHSSVNLSGVADAVTFAISLEKVKPVFGVPPVNMCAASATVTNNEEFPVALLYPGTPGLGTAPHNVELYLLPAAKGLRYVEVLPGENVRIKTTVVPEWQTLVRLSHYERAEDPPVFPVLLELRKPNKTERHMALFSADSVSKEVEIKALQPLAFDELVGQEPPQPRGRSRQAAGARRYWMSLLVPQCDRF